MSKYRSESCRCKTGHLHQSRGEAAFCDEVQLRIKAREITVEYQKTYPLDLVHPTTGERIHICNHRPDFTMTEPKSGRQWIEEYKGARTEGWRIKHALWQFCYPEIDYLIINHRPREKRFQGWTKAAVRRARKRC